MNQPTIPIFDYDLEISNLPEEWMTDMAVVFQEFDDDQDGIIPTEIAHHILDLFRLPSKDAFKESETVTLSELLDEAGTARDFIFLSPEKRYKHLFQMVASLGSNSIDALDIQRFIKVFGDDIPLKFCDDFIDEFDRKRLSKDSISLEEFCAFCATRKIPI